MSQRNADSHNLTVLVRRVVEARQKAAGEGAAGAQGAQRTAALPPPGANEAGYTANEKDQGEKKESWWRRLKCW
jgi:GTPase KRas protein